MNSWTSAVATLVLALAGVVPSSAHAQAPDATFAEARSQFELAVAAVRGGRPADAVPLFERSYAARPAPVVAINLALCLRGLGRLAEARRWYLAFRAAASADDLARHGATVDAHLEEISGRLGRIDVGDRAPAHAAVRLSDVLVGPGGVWVDPGTHRVEAGARGFRPGESTLSVRAGETVRLEVRLTPEEAHIPVTRRWWFWTAIGVAVAGVTTAVLVPLFASTPQDSDVHTVHLP